jgi:hypothetical protein
MDQKPYSIIQDKVQTREKEGKEKETKAKEAKLKAEIEEQMILLTQLKDIKRKILTSKKEEIQRDIDSINNSFRIRPEDVSTIKAFKDHIQDILSEIKELNEPFTITKPQNIDKYEITQIIQDFSKVDCSRHNCSRILQNVNKYITQIEGI